MKIAVIGAGKWGTNIVRTLHNLESLACIIDPSEAQRDKLGSEYGVPTFASFEEADLSLFEGVAIASPAELHEPQAITAMEAGKHAFAEKPMALSVESAERMIAKAKETGKTLMTGHLLMYQPAVSWIGEQIKSGLIGDLRSIHIRRLNLGRARDVESVLWALGVHDLAVVADLIQAEPLEVRASGDDFLNQGIHDDTHLHMTFPGNIKAHVQSSWLWPYCERMTVVVGTTGFLVYDELKQTVTHHKKHIDEALQNVDEGEEIAFEGAAQPLTLELQHFMDCCVSGEEPRSGSSNALTVTKLLEMADKAIS